MTERDIKNRLGETFSWGRKKPSLDILGNPVTTIYIEHGLGGGYFAVGVPGLAPEYTEAILAELRSYVAGTWKMDTIEGKATKATKVDKDE